MQNGTKLVYKLMIECFGETINIEGDPITMDFKVSSSK